MQHARNMTRDQRENFRPFNEIDKNARDDDEGEMKIIAKFQFLIAGRYCLHTKHVNACPPINLDKRCIVCN